MPEFSHQNDAQKSCQQHDCIYFGGASEPFFVGDFGCFFSEEEYLCGYDAIVEYVEQGCEDDAAAAVVDDAEDDAEGEGVESLCEVEVCDAEGEC